MADEDEDPTRKLRRPAEIVTWIAIAVVPFAVLYLPRPAAAIIAALFVGIASAVTYRSGMRVGVAITRAAREEARRG